MVRFHHLWLPASCRTGRHSNPRQIWNCTPVVSGLSNNFLPVSEIRKLAPCLSAALAGWNTRSIAGLSVRAGLGPSWRLRARAPPLLQPWCRPHCSFNYRGAGKFLFPPKMTATRPGAKTLERHGRHTAATQARRRSASGPAAESFAPLELPCTCCKRTCVDSTGSSIGFPAVLPGTPCAVALCTGQQIELTWKPKDVSQSNRGCNLAKILCLPVPSCASVCRIAEPS